VSVIKFSFPNTNVNGDPQSAKEFVFKFFASPEAAPFMSNPDGQPGVFFYGPGQPLNGLQPFGFEAADMLESSLDLNEGDIVFLQARKNSPFTGGSTSMGRLRLAVHKFAVTEGYIPPLDPKLFEFLWITDFPLFSPINDSDPGQGGSAGLCSTHHPFTSPLSAKDVDHLATSPGEALADHYDVVVNGVELGGGSRRIHDARMQEYILRDVLKMSKERLKDFQHLLDVLDTGCPPHAGIALGFDRLIAVMLGRESLRDVIAFPKNGKGEDVLVKSPNRMTPEQLATYHLKIVH
jgi:aspartyl-tRNA synthetase